MADSGAATGQVISLRVIAGEQKGASIELENRGGYSIGASEDCSVVLVGEGLADIHIESVFLDGSLTVLDCEDDVMVDNSPHGATPFTVSQGQLISFAGITITIGSADTDWDELAKMADERQKEAEEEKKKAIQKARAVRSGNLILVAAAVCLVSLVGGLIWWLVSFESETSATSSAPSENSAAPAKAAQIPSSSDSVDADDNSQSDPAQKKNISIDELLASNPEFDNLEVVGFQGDNPARPIIKGLLPSAAALEDLHSDIHGTKIVPVYRVAVIDQLASDAKVAMRKYDLGLSVELSFAASKLKMVITGLAANFQSDEDLIDVIKKDMPLVDEIEVKVRTAQDLLSDLRKLVAGRPELEGIGFSIDTGRLEMTGNVLGNYKAEIETKIGAVLDNYKPNSMDVVNKIQIGPNFDDKVVSVLISKNSRFAVIDKDGREFRALVGSELQDGVVLKEINKNHLIVEAQGIEFFVPVD